MCHSQIAFQNDFVKEVFWFNDWFRNDKITVLQWNHSLTFTFYETFSNSKPKNNFCKKSFDLMVSLKSDKMTALWANSIPKW